MNKKKILSLLVCFLLLITGCSTDNSKKMSDDKYLVYSDARLKQFALDFIEKYPEFSNSEIN